MKTKVLFICMAVCAMVMGLVSCEPVNNDNSPLVGQWIVEGDDLRTIEFDEEKFLVQLKELKELAETDDENIRFKVQEMVSTYHIQD